MNTDYIGQIANTRWNSQTSGWLMRTPAWMEGSFKAGPRISQRQFSAPSAGIRQNWGRSDIADGGIKFMSRAQGRSDKDSPNKSMVGNYLFNKFGSAPTNTPSPLPPPPPPIP